MNTAKIDAMNRTFKLGTTMSAGRAVTAATGVSLAASPAFAQSFLGHVYEFDAAPIRECMTGIAMRKKGLTEPHFVSPSARARGQNWE